MKDHLFCYKFIIQILIKQTSTNQMPANGIAVLLSSNQNRHLCFGHFTGWFTGIFWSVQIFTPYSNSNYTPIPNPTQKARVLHNLVGLPLRVWSPKVRFFIFFSDKKFFSLFLWFGERRNVRIEKKWRSGSHLTPERQYRSSKNVWATQIPWAHLPTFS